MEEAMAKSELTRRELLALSALGVIAGAPGFAQAAGPQGQLTWGIHVSLAPTWFDPAETPGLITPFMILSPLHDARVKPMPGEPLAPCLAESFSAAEDGRSYDFVLRQGAKFHNGDPITAEDVKFSFERGRRARAQEVRRDGRGRRVQEGAYWRRPLQIRVVHAWRRIGIRGFRPVLAQDPERQTPSIQGDPRRVDPASGIEARRGRHRLFDPRRAGRGAAQHARAHPKAGGLAGHVLALLRRSVGPAIALARRAGASGGQSRPRPQDDQRGSDPGLLEAHQQHRSGELRFLLAAAAGGLRSGESQAIAG